MPTEFTKIEGTGNDFVLFEKLEKITPETIRSVCDRHFGIGADGLISLKFSAADFVEVDFYNSDGSSATMCGNALRAIAAYLLKVHQLSSATVKLGGRNLRVGTTSDKLQFATFPVVTEIKGPVVEVAEYGEAYFLNTGTEHVVIPLPDLSDLPVTTLGRELRYHSAFAPKGTNINFVRWLNPGALEIRTYERGVEDETLSCGSGSVAAAIVGRYLGILKEEEIVITNRSPFPTRVKVPGNTLPIGDVELIGPANVVFRGEIELP